jgi:hypothetical protein
MATPDPQHEFAGLPVVADGSVARVARRAMLLCSISVVEPARVQADERSVHLRMQRHRIFSGHRVAHRSFYRPHQAIKPSRPN